MSIKPLISISVRGLVEYVYRGGDIFLGFFKQSSAIDGIKGHKIVQDSKGKEYRKEVSISYLYKGDLFDLKIGGRVDGVFFDKDQVIIEEIKTTNRPLGDILKPKRTHLSQAKLYAYFYAKKHSLASVNVQLTYFHIDSKKTKCFSEPYVLEDLEHFFKKLISIYLEWAKILYSWHLTRDESLSSLSFPFAEYRTGQKKLIKIAKEMIKKEKYLFVQAPTGIGKTIGILYPSLQALAGENHCKIFYLTAKTTTRSVVQETFEILFANGLHCKTIILTAKAKTCFKEEQKCTPDFCEFAKGHYDRVNEAITDVFLHENLFTQQVIETYAQKHQVCPFEFSLDLSLYADVIVCDYNYVFDPRVYLRRFFLEGNDDYIFLIDEAHNLVDRSRAMFSAQLYKREFLELKRKTKEKCPSVSKILWRINLNFVEIRKKIEKTSKNYLIKDNPPSKHLIQNLNLLCKRAEAWLVLNEDSVFRQQLIDLYFDVRAFLNILELFDYYHVVYYQNWRRNLKMNIFCIDPSVLLHDILKRGKAVIFFSATLSPMNYFVELLGGKEKAAKLILPSPFPEENLKVLIADNISTKYRDRDVSYTPITDLLSTFVQFKTSNYICYFPSYAYLEHVLDAFQEKNSSMDILIQESEMSEHEREMFLNKFSEDNKNTLVGFGVLGGIFSESIDLVGEKLTGVAIIGPGLPKVCLERNLIKDYFDKINHHGFLFAYTFPGLSKVQQAMGRVIRSSTDKGVVILVGKRFTNYFYSSIFTKNIRSYSIIKTSAQLKSQLESFWVSEEIR